MAMFYERQWNQVQAALVFWKAVSKESRVHPMEHPAVQDFFLGDSPTPLTNAEIDCLLVNIPVVPLATIIDITRGEVKTKGVRDWLSRHGIKRCGVEKGRALYPIPALWEAFMAVRNAT